MSFPKALWKGVYPAVTTQFAEDLSVDLDATQAVQAAHKGIYQLDPATFFDSEG